MAIVEEILDDDEIIVSSNDDESGSDSDGSESVDSSIVDSDQEEHLTFERKLTWSTPLGANLAELSDSDDDQGPLRRTGTIPEHWYDELDHLGYNIDGRPITRGAAAGAIDQFLQSQTKQGRRTIYDADNDTNVVLSKHDMEVLKRIRDGCYADPGFDETSELFQVECPSYPHPLGNVQTPNKSRFIASKHEAKIVEALVKRIRSGAFDNDKKPDPGPYLIWDQTEDDQDRRHRPPPVVSAPKPTLPGHGESYNPPEEYLPDDDEIRAWNEKDDEERAGAVLPTRFDSHREIPVYDQFVHDRFERCLDLYMCPRKRINKLNIDPESLLPKLPKPSSLKPFPQVLCQSYDGGQTMAITSISVSACGQYLASASLDRSVCLFEIETGRLLRRLDISDPVVQVSFNPFAERRALLAIMTSTSIQIVNALDSHDPDLIRILTSGAEPNESNSKCHVDWKVDVGKAQIRIAIPASGKRLAWHRSGDYLLSVADTSSQPILIHQLSTRKTQAPFKRTKTGAVQDASFHPTRPYLVVAEKRRLRLYDLQKQVLVKKLSCPARWISTVAMHPSGDHLITGTADRRVCWYDLQLSSKPFRTLKYHGGAVRDVRCHNRLPLWATASDDGSAHVLHGAVSQDLIQDPILVPLKAIRAHIPADGVGITSIQWHPDQPWLFTAGADHKIHMFVP